MKKETLKETLKKIQQNEFLEIGFMIILSIFLNLLVEVYIPSMTRRIFGIGLHLPSLYVLPVLFVGLKYGWKKGGLTGIVVYLCTFLINDDIVLYYLSFYGTLVTTDIIINFILFILWGILPELFNKKFNLSCVFVGITITFLRTLVIFIFNRNFSYSFVSSLLTYSLPIFILLVINLTQKFIKKKSKRKNKEIEVIKKDGEIYMKLDREQLKKLLKD